MATLPPDVLATYNRTFTDSDFCSLSIGWNVVETDVLGFYLNLCFITLIVCAGVDLFGLIANAIYYFGHVRKYVDFKSRMDQKTLPTALFFVKITLVIFLAFQWIVTKLAAKRVEIIDEEHHIIYDVGYPYFLVLGDILHMTAWLANAAIVYLEWNRSLQSAINNRIFWIMSMLAHAVKLHSLIEYDRRGLDIGFWNNVGSNVAILLVYIALSIFGILSWIPFFRPHLEPDTSKSELEKSEPSPDEEKPASLFDFLKLITGKGLRTALLLLTIGAVCAGAKGYIMQKVNYYDGIAFNQARLDDTDGIMETLKITATLYGAYSLGSGLALMFSSVAAEKIINGTNGIRNKLFRNLLEQEMAYHDKLSSGVIASRFSNDAERVKQLLAEALPAFIENMSLVAFGLFFLFGTSWSLTLYMVGLVPITFGANYYQSEKLETFMEVSQTQNAAMSERIQEVFSKYMTVLTYGKQQFEQWSYARLVKNIYRTLRSKVVFTAVLVSITGFLAFGTQILAFFLGVELFRVQSFGNFITFCLYAMNVVFGLIEVLKLVPMIGEAIGASGAVLKMLERRPRSPEFSSGGSLPDITVQDGTIEFRDVVFSYPGSDRTALNGINFVVQKNTKVALIGDSGAGKSTVLQLIARFYDPQNGQILVDGQDIKRHNVKSIRNHVAMVKQGADLFATTILENVAYGRGDPSADEDNVALMEETIEAINSGQSSRTSKRIVDGVMMAVDQAHATDFVRGKLTMTLGEGGKGLSGGQRQRVTIARALFKDPKILLLDEVTSALDQVSEAVVQRAIDRLTANRTVFIVAHRLHTIQNADKILLLSGGKIAAEGTHDQLMASSDRYREMIAAAKRDEELKHKDTRSSRAVTLLREIYDYISPLTDMKPLGVKISEILSQVEEQDRKIRESHDALASIVAPPNPSSHSLLLDDASDDDDDDGGRKVRPAGGDNPPPRSSANTSSSSPSALELMNFGTSAPASVSEDSTLMNISERPAPILPSDDEDETF